MRKDEENCLHMKRGSIYMKLYILRHGQTLWNTQKRMQGQTDILLNEEGIRLAEETGRGMKDIDIDMFCL